MMIDSYSIFGKKMNQWNSRNDLSIFFQIAILEDEPVNNCHGLQEMFS